MIHTHVHKMKEGARCVFGLKETEPAASEERGGRDEETWDGLVMKQPFMPQRTEPTPLTRLLPFAHKDPHCVDECVCCSPTLLRVCVTVLTHTHSYYSRFHKHTRIHTGIYHQIFMPIPETLQREVRAVTT